MTQYLSETEILTISVFLKQQSSNSILLFLWILINWQFIKTHLLKPLWLFESITESTIEDLQQSIQTQIESTFPNIQIQTLQVLGQPDTNQINMGDICDIADKVIRLQSDLTKKWHFIEPAITRDDFFGLVEGNHFKNFPNYIIDRFIKC